MKAPPTRADRDLALLRTIRRGQRMGLSLADSLAGTGIPLSHARRVIAAPRPKSPNRKTTQGKNR